MESPKFIKWTKSPLGASSFPDQKNKPKITRQKPSKFEEPKVTKFMRDCLDKAALLAGFRSYEVRVDYSSLINSHRLMLFKAIVQEKDKSRKIMLVVKTPKKGQISVLDHATSFQREVFVYSRLLPEFIKFQDDKKISKSMQFTNYPKCFYAEYNESKNCAIIILEDLFDAGFSMWDVFEPTSFEHAKLLVTALGKFHAISFAMKAQRSPVFDEFKMLTDQMVSQMSASENFEAILNSNIKAAYETLDEGDFKRKNRVLSLKENVWQQMSGLVDFCLAEPFTVVSHGDCWTNNLLFHYEKGIPENIKFIDWHNARYCSPVLDLVNFLFICTDKKMRAKHYDELISIYHRSLQGFLYSLGGDVMTQFPFTALLRQLKQYGKYGVLMSANLLPILSMKTEELPDIDFLSENANYLDHDVIKEVAKSFYDKSEEAFKPRMKEVIIDACRYGYL